MPLLPPNPEDEVSLPTSDQTIQTLITARDALARATDSVSADAAQPLQDTIDDTNAEIDALTAAELGDADYVPQTDPFNAATETGKAFINRLNAIKSALSAIESVVGAANTILGVMTKLA